MAETCENPPGIETERQLQPYARTSAASYQGNSRSDITVIEKL